jgi:hypothetical protein
VTDSRGPWHDTPPTGTDTPVGEAVPTREMALRATTPTREMPALQAPPSPPSLAPVQNFGAPAPSNSVATAGPSVATDSPARAIAVKIFATIGLGAFVATYVAVEVDLLRRHFPGIEPVKYWLPQLEQVTLPGLAATLFAAAVAFALHRWKRRA